MTPRYDRSMLLFALMCLIWGATWVAIKVGLAAVPPVLFAGTRFLAAGALLLACQAATGRSLAVDRRDGARLAGATLLMMALTYPLLFWGALHVPSGLAAVIDLSFLPVALLAFAVFAGEERFDRRRAGAIALGVVGLAVLFSPKALAEGRDSAMALWGGGAIVLSALLYAGGSVLARPLLRAYPAVLVSGLTLFWGGLLTTAGALLFEPGAREALSLRWGSAAWSAWLYLLLGGSIAAHTIYLRLVRDWGPSRAGAYCFVSPAIAVLLGVVVLGERVGAAELIGMGAMLTAASLALRDAGEARLERAPSTGSVANGGRAWNSTKDG